MSLRLFGVLAILALSPMARAIDVSRDAASQRQRFDGWGTSLAWWGNGVGSWADAGARTDLMNRVFDSANGLGLTYARYNVGGGQNRRFSGNMRPGALVQGWVPSAPSDVSDPSTWVWNWDADATQRRVLDEALSMGVSRVDAISYSAPYWMTYSQDSAGNINGAPNLPPENVDSLAHYQAEVVRHFYENLDVQFQAFSPLNEPDVNWWVAGGRQEGMVVPPGAQQRNVIQAVGEAFADRDLPIGLSASEETNATKAISSWNQFDSATKDYVTYVHTHTYGNNGASTLNQLRDLAQIDGKKIYMSEYGNNSTTGLLGGVALANRITLDVNELGANGWAYWQVIEPGVLTTTPQSAWGLLWTGYEQSDSGYTVRKQYHVMRQFTHAIRPGSTILDTGDADTLAAYDPDADATVLVVSNQTNTPTAKSYDLAEGAPEFVRAIRTSDLEDFESLGRWNPSANLSVDGPGPSVTTLVLHHQPNLIVDPHVDDAPGSPGSGAWSVSGAASVVADSGPGESTPGSLAIPATVAAGPSVVWQEGIGESGVDVTGKAFQLSLDVRTMDLPNELFSADATLGLEFYGADGETLTHDASDAFAEVIDPIVSDTAWRTFRTSVAMAPAGTRFVRPVVRVTGAAADSDATLRLDNFYLQEIRHVPRGRHWLPAGNGGSDDASNWEFDADRSLHDRWLLGPANAGPASVSVETEQLIHQLTIDSPNLYRVAGAGLRLHGSEIGAPALVDIRDGQHLIGAPIDLDADAVVQAVGDASVTFSGVVDADGFGLRMQGDGLVSFTGNLQLSGGRLEVFAGQDAGVRIGPAATLDGALHVLLAPGQQASAGQTFELVSYSGAVIPFEAIVFPELPSGLDWQSNYGSDALIASIVESILAGDYNDDGVVDSADYVIWRDSVGDPPGSLPNDPNSSPIGNDQYHTWAANFGATSNASLGVPEPAATMLVVVAWISCRKPSRNR